MEENNLDETLYNLNLEENVCKCNKCGIEKPLSEYSKDNDKKSKHKKICKTCKSIYDQQYRSILKNKIKSLFNDAYKRHKENKKEGDFDLSPQYLNNLYNEQNGKCFYSNIPMNVNGSWKISLERLDTSKTYMEGNVVFCVLEMNVQSNFSEKKLIDMVPNVELSKYFGNPINDDIINENIRYHLHNLNYDCKKRNNKFRKNDCETKYIEYDISDEFLVKLYKEQNGRCYYSNIPMRCGTREDYWVISVERKDSNIGYCKTNICLICNEFNSTDRATKASTKKIIPIEERNNWSKEKFQYFYKTFQTHPLYQKGLEKKENYDTNIRLDLVISKCSRCDEYFERKAKTSYKTHCEKCIKTMNVLEYKELIESDTIIERTCTQCKNTFPLNADYFYLNNHQTLGFHTFCKTCKKKKK